MGASSSCCQDTKDTKSEVVATIPKKIVEKMPTETELALTELEGRSPSKPVLHYFDISGRGELSKLIAAVGGVEIDVVEYPFAANGASAADKLKAGVMETEHTKAATAMGMEGCGLPILVHGDLKINQSFAIQDYLVSISTKYPPVNPLQKGVDDMFEGALEDCMGVGAGIILSGVDPSAMVAAMEKTLTHLSRYIPEKGFVNGFETPSKADLVILMLTQALIPFGATLGGYDFAKFPAAKALGERAAAFPAVAAWLQHENCCLKKPPRAARAAAGSASAKSLIVTFEFQGKTFEQKWEHRPLGLELGAAPPSGCCSGAPPGKFVVTKVSDANLKNIKVGALVKQVDGEDVKPLMEWPDFKAMLGSKLEALPAK
eukprot:TRINITY_DN18183_c0_g3_i1.p1 TRINITY_DN18183_c0_g3~~TRINITY_DN18183_c0_g3_i1.p1  ORF type:complete len:374 (+),score=78.21 TRINITY_DN18183_c0_g3_i1:82-1203(+)